MAIKSVLLPLNIIDLITCAVAAIHNFFQRLCGFLWPKEGEEGEVE